MLTDKQLMCGLPDETRNSRNAVCWLLTNWCRLDTSFSTDIDRSPTWPRSERGVGCVEPRIGAGVQLLAQHVRMHVRRFRQPFTNRQHACADLIFNLIANVKPILFHTLSIMQAVPSFIFGMFAEQQKRASFAVSVVTSRHAYRNHHATI